MVVGYLVAGLLLGFPGLAEAQSRTEDSFGRWTLLRIVDAAEGPTRVILETRQGQTGGEGWQASLTFRCRSDEVDRLEGVFRVSGRSLPSRPTPRLTFDFGEGSSLTQSWSGAGVDGRAFKGAAYSWSMVDLSALLRRLVEARTLQVRASSLDGQIVGANFFFFPEDTTAAVVATMEACFGAAN
ncbi:MAG: hypothetical protein KKG14_08575 [Alphaproteobacteria bacterium]|nr:hypothetical protein [Alphaproteobacteria bacterium]MBU2272525.1 hypothetical protein [Alphaproteobacteria bacterium]MBU2418744.1 hypothetical protein [Alphaproteobacteria bacterium]